VKLAGQRYTQTVSQNHWGAPEKLASALGDPAVRIPFISSNKHQYVCRQKPITRCVLPSSSLPPAIVRCEGADIARWPILHICSPAPAPYGECTSCQWNSVIIDLPASISEVKPSTNAQKLGLGKVPQDQKKRSTTVSFLIRRAVAPGKTMPIFLQWAAVAVERRKADTQLTPHFLYLLVLRDVCCSYCFHLHITEGHTQRPSIQR
jgi:hypothetical protein